MSTQIFAAPSCNNRRFTDNFGKLQYIRPSPLFRRPGHRLCLFALDFSPWLRASV